MATSARGSGGSDPIRIGSFKQSMERLKFQSGSALDLSLLSLWRTCGGSTVVCFPNPLIPRLGVETPEGMSDCLGTF
jgi:hypothetical protein